VLIHSEHEHSPSENGSARAFSHRKKQIQLSRRPFFRRTVI